MDNELITNIQAIPITRDAYKYNQQYMGVLHNRLNDLRRRRDLLQGEVDKKKRLIQEAETQNRQLENGIQRSLWRFRKSTERATDENSSLAHYLRKLDENVKILTQKKGQLMVLKDQASIVRDAMVKENDIIRKFLNRPRSIPKNKIGDVRSLVETQTGQSGHVGQDLINAICAVDWKHLQNTPDCRRVILRETKV